MQTIKTFGSKNTNYIKILNNNLYKWHYKQVVFKLVFSIDMLLLNDSSLVFIISVLVYYEIFEGI